MKALALFIVLSAVAQMLISSTAMRVFRERPPSPVNQDENKRRMAEYLTERWGAHLRALSAAQVVAGFLLALVVLLG